MDKQHIGFFNSQIISKEYIQKLHNEFDKQGPFKYLIIDNALEVNFAKEIENKFPSITSMKVKYKGLNENKTEDSSFGQFDESIQDLNNLIHSNNTTELISAITGFSDLSTIPDRLGAGLHQGGRESFLDIHIDYNIHPLKKVQRKLNLILFFNQNWKSEWGGELEFWDAKSKTCFKKILPVFNRMVLFECNELSFHGYSQIKCPKDITRKSYYHYFFQPITKKMKFHDTIFLINPNDSIFKRNLTRTKEYLKNNAKAFFYKINFHKYLK